MKIAFYYKYFLFLFLRNYESICFVHLHNRFSFYKLLAFQQNMVTETHSVEIQTLLLHAKLFKK